MTTLRRLALLPLLLLAASVVEGQQVQQLPRITPTTGLADSSLFLCVDSTKTLTRACKFSLVQQRLAFKAFDSLRTAGKLTLTGATIIGSPTWSSVQTFAATQRVDSSTGAARASALVGSPAITVSSCTGCGGGGATVSDTIKTVTFDSVRTVRLRADTIRSQAGASKRLVVQTTTSGSALTTAMRFNEMQQSLVAAGAVGNPSIGFVADTNTGIYSIATGRIGIGTAGANRIDLNSTRMAMATNIWGSSSGTAAAPSLAVNGTGTNGFYPFGTDTIGVSTGGVASLGIRGGATPTIFGGAGNMTIQAGTGNSRTMALQATDASGVATTMMTLNASSANTSLWTAGTSILTLSPTGTSTTINLRAQNPSSSTLIIQQISGSDSSSAFLGRVKPQADNAVSLGTSALHWTNVYGDSLTGSGAMAIVGGAGNMTVTAGTGNSRTMTLQSTTSAGTAKNTVVLGADTSTTLLGRLIVAKGTASAPIFTNVGNTGDGLYFGAAGDSVNFAINSARAMTIAGGAAATWQGGAGNLTVQAGTGNSRQLALQTTTSGGTATTAARFNEVQQTLIANGTSTRPSIASSGDTTTGFAFGVTTSKIDVINSGFRLWQFTDDSRINPIAGDNNNLIGTTTLALQGLFTYNVTGGAGNFTLLAGTGASRTVTLQSTNSSSVATAFLVGSGDTVKFSAHAIATGFTAAAGTPGSICYNTATSEITKNNATSCVVSSIRFKKNVKPLALDSALEIVRRLTPVTYEMKEGGRPTMHVIAEQADSISRRLSFREANGQVNSVDDGAILSALLRVVQDQKRQLDSIKTAALKGKKP